MTDLTEQWEKGELPSGEYYTLVNGGSYEDYTSIQFYNEYTNEFDKHPLITKQVLAPMPSYEEWEQLKEELKDYEYQHKQDGICYNDLFCKLELARKENAKLKTDCNTLAQKLLQVKPELREWLEVNFKEYL